MKNYETELPQGYVLAKTIDAKADKKVIIWFNVFAFLVVAVTTLAVFLAYGLNYDKLIGALEPAVLMLTALVFFVVVIAYVVLHELVHGIMYKALTKQKLTFGFTLSVAFCGVPNIYVYRKTALLAVLAPFAVFLPIFTALPFALDLYVHKLLAWILWGMHVGGCVGDLYVAFELLFKYRDKTVLMNDTGPKQTFYVLSRNEPIQNALPDQDVSANGEETPAKQDDE